MRNAEKDEAMMAARRELILRKGFELFAKKGIEQVSMLEVANACGIGIATLYRYFNTKLALALAIATCEWRKYADYVREEQERCDAAHMTAAEELAFYLDFYIDLYQNHSPILCFNQDFNNFVRHEGISKAQLQPYLEAVGAFAGMFHGVYEKGKQDGTLRVGLSEEKMFAATSHIMLAVAVRYAQGLLYSADDEADRTEEMQLVRRMILREFDAVPEARPKRTEQKIKTVYERAGLGAMAI